MLALPVLWINGLAMLVGVIALVPSILGPTPASRWLAATSQQALVQTLGADPAASPRP